MLQFAVLTEFLELKASRRGEPRHKYTVCRGKFVPFNAAEPRSSDRIARGSRGIEKGASLFASFDVKLWAVLLCFKR
jgi:hypothetical protein